MKRECDFISIMYYKINEFRRIFGVCLLTIDYVCPNEWHEHTVKRKVIANFLTRYEFFYKQPHWRASSLSHKKAQLARSEHFRPRVVLMQVREGRGCVIRKVDPSAEIETHRDTCTKNHGEGLASHRRLGLTRRCSRWCFLLQILEWRIDG